MMNIICYKTINTKPGWIKPAYGAHPSHDIHHQPEARAGGAFCSTEATLLAAGTSYIPAQSDTE